MSTRNVTITSKNQITLPSEYVKTLNLAQSRVLQADIQGGKIVLYPQPALGAVMKRFWGKHSAKRAITEEELKQAVRTTSAKRAVRTK